MSLSAEEIRDWSENITINDHLMVVMQRYNPDNKYSSMRIRINLILPKISTKKHMQWPKDEAKVITPNKMPNSLSLISKSCLIMFTETEKTKNND